MDPHGKKVLRDIAQCLEDTSVRLIFMCEESVIHGVAFNWENWKLPVPRKDDIITVDYVPYRVSEVEFVMDSKHIIVRLERERS